MEKACNAGSSVQALVQANGTKVTATFHIVIQGAHRWQLLVTLYPTWNVLLTGFDVHNGGYLHIY